MFNRVVVGVDERSAGRDGIALAENLTARGGQLTLVYVLTSDPLFYRGASAAVAEAERARAVKLLETARELAATNADLRWATSSSVGVGLHKIAEEVGANLLVLGSSFRGLLGRVLVGDDTQASLNGASCAVAIAPAGYSQGAGSIGEVGVGYDGSPESQAVVEIARAIAAPGIRGSARANVARVRRARGSEGRARARGRLPRLGGRRCFCRRDRLRARRRERGAVGMRRSRVNFSELPPGRRAGMVVLGAVQLGLLIAAERDIQRRPAPLVRGSKTRWRLVCLINFLGPLSYFTFGRRTERA